MPVWLIWVVWWTTSVKITLEKKKKEEIHPWMLCFSVTKVPQLCQPNSVTEGDGLVTLQSCTYWLVSNSLIWRDILCFLCVVQKDVVHREYFLSELLCEEQRQSSALGGHELSVGSGYHWSRSVVGGSEMASYQSHSSYCPHQTGGWETRTSIPCSFCVFTWDDFVWRGSKD